VGSKNSGLRNRYLGERKENRGFVQRASQNRIYKWDEGKEVRRRKKRGFVLALNKPLKKKLSERSGGRSGGKKRLSKNTELASAKRTWDAEKKKKILEDPQRLMPVCGEEKLKGGSIVTAVSRVHIDV